MVRRPSHGILLVRSGQPGRNPSALLGEHLLDPRSIRLSSTQGQQEKSGGPRRPGSSTQRVLVRSLMVVSLVTLVQRIISQEQREGTEIRVQEFLYFLCFLLCVFRLL
jgi:hypothetical protein